MSVLAVYTLLEATEFFNAAKSAYLNALQSASYSHGDKSKYNQKIDDLKKDMDYWARIKDSLSSSSEKAFAHVSFS